MDADEQRWDEQFANSQDELDAMADKVLAAYAAGETEEFDPDEDDWDDDPLDPCGMASDDVCDFIGSMYCEWHCPYQSSGTDRFDLVE